MQLTERLMLIPASPGHLNLLDHLRNEVTSRLDEDTIPVRIAVIDMDESEYRCEIGLINGFKRSALKHPESIFRFVPRLVERTKEFNAVLVVPTGIGAEIGGHAGDATPVARVVAAACDTLITHPNVVNASDLNEMTENTLYVEGSLISRLLMGTACLQPVRSNRVLMIMDEHPIKVFANDSINAVSAARAVYGLDCDKVVKLSPPLKMTAEFARSGRAAGRVSGLDRILDVFDQNKDRFDAVAISSIIDFDDALLEQYFSSDGQMTNPWGGVEAMLTHALSMLYELPTAHAPMLESHEAANLDLGLVEPRLAAEAVSMTFSQCMLKGLQCSPRIVTDAKAMREAGLISAADISCLIIPDNCVGLPTLAALEQEIPVIAVRENRNLMSNDLNRLPWRSNQLHIVDNYWEAVGVMTALRVGISPKSLRRPMNMTKVERHYE